ncbi:MAG: ABC-F family ATP-binding cassette domain-containing protein [Pseudomonadota bacterium]
MTHKPIKIDQVSLFFPHKICFADFTASLHYGNRIAIIGANGSGKSTLLKILQDKIEPSSGTVQIPDDVICAYVPQVIDSPLNASGGERFNKKLTEALSCNPNLLLLDEPTNHLDYHNRQSLMRMLKAYHGSLIVVSHDVELLRRCVDSLWHIDDGEIHVFSGNYDDYVVEQRRQRAAIEKTIAQLNKQKKQTHEMLMREQKRAANSRKKGRKNIINRKWAMVTSFAKATRAEMTSGRKKAAIDDKKTMARQQLADLKLAEVIVPKFSIKGAVSNAQLVAISDASVAYDNHVVLSDINLSVNAQDRIAICGNNGSGKSTLIKAILSCAAVKKTGHWVVPKLNDIAYLDQHYKTLDEEMTVFDTIAESMPLWSAIEARRHLNDFLFRKNEEINANVATLSGGEKARLSLAQIAAVTPKLLILDEVTNNLDLETYAHVVQVLKHYPGAMFVISHNSDFLKEIAVTRYYIIQNSRIFAAKDFQNQL